ncbi:hypothetical protein, partial [Xanthomonas cannabis]|uniref:hypothetical protein n=1 Tax=Xanthomonas cannabis TaxID=1885674 RepID=UPI001C8F8556
DIADARMRGERALHCMCGNSAFAAHASRPWGAPVAAHACCFNFIAIVYPFHRMQHAATA